jgi:hypothetical protein
MEIRELKALIACLEALEKDWLRGWKKRKNE